MYFLGVETNLTQGGEVTARAWEIPCWQTAGVDTCEVKSEKAADCCCVWLVFAACAASKLVRGVRLKWKTEIWDMSSKSV